MATQSTPHLWEVKHPYYCDQSDDNKEYDSWDDFVNEVQNQAQDYDPQRNLIFRWDWISPDSPDYEADLYSDGYTGDRLTLFVVLQRKARVASWEIKVTKENEQAIKSWLSERAKHITALWTPIQIAS